MQKLEVPSKNARVRRMGPTQRATMINRSIRYRPALSLSSPKNENLRLCSVEGCIEPRSDQSGLCPGHYQVYCRVKYRRDRSEYQAFFDAKREAVIQALLEASSSAEREAIQQGRRAGRKLRRELERAEL
jgi:hypothetical protein